MPGVGAYAEDYAYLIFGLLELFQATGEPRWLEWAVTLQHTQDRLFWDETGGGWFSTTGDDRSVLLRLKEDYDGAEPAASSVSAANVMALAHLTGDDVWARRLEATFRMFAARAAASGRMVPMCMAALSVYHAGVSEVVIAGEPGDKGFEELRAAASRRYCPSAVLIPVTPATRLRLETLLPWIRAMVAREGRATAYVCRDFTCQMPAYTPRDLADRLASLSAVPR
jgi:uncharacterized protein YyaL (SSP411 family)